VSERVVAAFPATGKSFVAATRPNVVDSDSSAFSRGSEWPGDYIEHIRSAAAGGALVLVSTHAEVRAALEAEGIPFMLVYPDAGLRDEYRARMERRGSPAGLIHKVIDDLWDDALADCAAQSGCEHIVLRSGEYLSDVLPPSAPSRPVAVEQANAEREKEARDGR
jgi:hypothetical protein